MKEDLRESHKYKLWQANLSKNGLTIHDTKEIHTRYRHNGEALFSLVLLDASTPEGDKIPPICFIKGEVVSILVCLIDQDTNEKYLLLVKQRRICNGGEIYEHVAGMVDRDDDPLEVAIREAEEEAGVTLHKEQVIQLNDEPYYPSTGTSDEAMYFFYTEILMSKEEIMAYDGKDMGVEYEHERIRTHISTIPEALSLITNTNGLLNIYMYLAAIEKA